MVRGLTWRSSRLDLLIGQQRVVDALALEIAVAHHLGAAEHFGVELVGAVHVLHRQAEMLDPLQPAADEPLLRSAADMVRSRPLWLRASVQRAPPAIIATPAV